MALCYLFLVSVSVTFHLMFIHHNIVLTLFWLLSGVSAAYSNDHVYSLCSMTICNSRYFQFGF